jgi:hypothetical protein
VLVDDSIVRGTTSGRIVQLLRDAGATEVHFRVSSPPIRFPCYYGIDTAARQELAAATMTVDEISGAHRRRLALLHLRGRSRPRDRGGADLPGLLRRPLPGGPPGRRPRQGGARRAGRAVPVRDGALHGALTPAVGVPQPRRRSVSPRTAAGGHAVPAPRVQADAPGPLQAPAPRPRGRPAGHAGEHVERAADADQAPAPSASRCASRKTSWRSPSPASTAAHRRAHLAATAAPSVGVVEVAVVGADHPRRPSAGGRPRPRPRPPRAGRRGGRRGAPRRRAPWQANASSTPGTRPGSRGPARRAAHTRPTPSATVRSARARASRRRASLRARTTISGLRVTTSRGVVPRGPQDEVDGAVEVDGWTACPSDVVGCRQASAQGRRARPRSVAGRRAAVAPAWAARGYHGPWRPRHAVVPGRGSGRHARKADDGRGGPGGGRLARAPNHPPPGDAPLPRCVPRRRPGRTLPAARGRPGGRAGDPTTTSTGRPWSRPCAPRRALGRAPRPAAGPGAAGAPRIARRGDGPAGRLAARADLHPLQGRHRRAARTAARHRGAAGGARLLDGDAGPRRGRDGPRLAAGARRAPAPPAPAAAAGARRGPGGARPGLDRGRARPPARDRPGRRARRPAPRRRRRAARGGRRGRAALERRLRADADARCSATPGMLVLDPLDPEVARLWRPCSSASSTTPRPPPTTSATAARGSRPAAGRRSSGAARAPRTCSSSGRARAPRAAAPRRRRLARRPRARAAAGAEAWLDHDPTAVTPAAGLRPVTQDAVLPSAVFVVGPGELRYLAQLRGVYELHGVPMPLIWPRASVTVLQPPVRRILSATGSTGARCSATRGAPTATWRCGATATPTRSRRAGDGRARGGDAARAGRRHRSDAAAHVRKGAATSTAPSSRCARRPRTRWRGATTSCGASSTGSRPTCAPTAACRSGSSARSRSSSRSASTRCATRSSSLPPEGDHVLSSEALRAVGGPGPRPRRTRAPTVPARLSAPSSWARPA